jgi:hypothetical protein
MLIGRPLSCVLGWLLASSPVLGVVPVAGEFQIHTYTPDNQRDGAIAFDGDGDFVVTWQSFHDGNQFGSFAQRFSSGGTKIGTDFQVNTFTVGQQTYPQVGVESDGDFVVVWISAGQDGSNNGVFGRRFTSNGAPIGGEFQINAYTSGSQNRPAIAMESNGDFVVAWSGGNNQDGSSAGIFARRFASSGASAAVEFLVNSYTSDAQSSVTIAADADGDFVIVWASYTQDGDHFGVFAQRFTSGGARSGAEFQVNSYSSSAQTYPAVSMEADGDFVVVWQTFLGYDGGYEIGGQRFASSGARLAGEFQVNAYTYDIHERARVASSSSGAFVVAWMNPSEGSGDGIFGRSFDSTGAADGTDFQVNAFTVGGQYRPLIAANAAGAFIVTWSSFDQDGSAGGVFGRRLGPVAPAAELDVDANGSVAALTDGLLILRHRFGFSGATLTAGAVGPNCQRCLAGDIAAYIAANLGLFDVDGNGATEALTDALLILRYVFGFRGGTLINGAVGPGCSRCDAPSIEAYLAPLVA